MRKKEDDITILGCVIILIACTIVVWCYLPWPVALALTVINSVGKTAGKIQLRQAGVNIE